MIKPVQPEVLDGEERGRTETTDLESRPIGHLKDGRVGPMVEASCGKEHGGRGVSEGGAATDGTGWLTGALIE